MNSAYDFNKGDKVVILRGEYKGIHGVIRDIQGEKVDVALPEGNAVLSITALQNFSSAARKAWRTRPDRGTGRPKDITLSPKRMVSLRIDVGVWDDLGKAVELGIIRSREAAVNQWLREKLDVLWQHQENFGNEDDEGGM